MNAQARVFPRWYVPPTEQISWVQSLIERHRLSEFTIEDIPSIPDTYSPNVEKNTEILMLAIYLPDKGRVYGLKRTFNLFVKELGLDTRSIGWDFDASEFKDSRRNINRMRLLNEAVYRPGIRWVAFDPNAYAGMSTEVVRYMHLKLTHQRLASVEVLQSALIFPELRRSWCSQARAARRRDTTPAPYLPGIEVDT